MSDSRNGKLRRTSPIAFIFPIFLLLLLIADPAHGQDGVDVSYSFDGTYEESQGGGELTTNGGTTLTSLAGEDVVLLSEQAWLDFPVGIEANIKTDESLVVAVDAYLSSSFAENHEPDSYRVLLANKQHQYITDVGFSIRLGYEEDAGDPSIIFNFGTGEVAMESKFNDVPYDQWHRISMTWDFALGTVTFAIGPRKAVHDLYEDIDGNQYDPSPGIASLKTIPPRLGGYQSFNNGTFGPPDPVGDNIATVAINSVLIQSPRPAGDADLARSALTAFTDHVSGAAVLDPSALRDQLVSLESSLIGVDATQVMPLVGDFVDAFYAEYDMIWPTEQDRAYTDLDIPEQAMKEVATWMLRNGLTQETVAMADGVVFRDHEAWPGSVPEAAERVSGASVDINGTFEVQEGYAIAGTANEAANIPLSLTYRPAGFYVPAGEIVTVDVDPSLVDSGAKLRVGAHTTDFNGDSGVNRFPLAVVSYPITQASMQVMNPLGGGLYVMIPQGADLGWVPLTVSGAVRSPYFSWREGRKMSRADWETQRTYLGPWADLESDKYQMTVQSEDIRDFVEVDSVLARMDRAMDMIQYIFGRPTDRVVAQGWVLDRKSSGGSSYPTGNPILPGLWAEHLGDVTWGAYTGFGLYRKVWREQWGDEFPIMFHEMGHAHQPYTLEGEVETIVDVFPAAVLNGVGEAPLGEAMRFAGFQRFTRTDAAITWMVQENFLAGEPISAERDQLAYQARGRAKYLDLVDIWGSWEAMYLINRPWYEADLAAGRPYHDQSVAIDRDAYLLAGSEALGCNLASLWHFWGIHPSASAATQLSAYPACDGALERIEEYARSAPRNNEEIRAFNAIHGSPGTGQLQTWVWDSLIEDWDLDKGIQLRNVVYDIADHYFDVDRTDPPTRPVPLTRDFSVQDGGPDTIEFNWIPAENDDDKPLTYSWKLFDVETGTVLSSAINLDEPSVTVQRTDLAQALAPYAAETEYRDLGQVVVTSDVYNVVASDTVLTFFKDGIATDVEDESLPKSHALVGNYPNPFNPSTRIVFELAAPESVTISVVDMLGREVAVLMRNEPKSAGRHQVQWDAGHLGSGMYMVRMQAGSYRASRAMHLVK